MYRRKFGARDGAFALVKCSLPRDMCYVDSSPHLKRDESHLLRMHGQFAFIFSFQVHMSQHVHAHVTLSG